MKHKDIFMSTQQTKQYTHTHEAQKRVDVNIVDEAIHTHTHKAQRHVDANTADKAIHTHTHTHTWSTKTCWCQHSRQSNTHTHTHTHTWSTSACWYYKQTAIFTHMKHTFWCKQSKWHKAHTPGPWPCCNQHSYHSNTQAQSASYFLDLNVLLSTPGHLWITGAQTVRTNTTDSAMHKNMQHRDIKYQDIQSVSWCFEPSQPQIQQYANMKHSLVYITAVIRL